MNYTTKPYRIFPLGDAAITIDFGNSISESFNREVIARFQQIEQHPLPGMIELVPAYSSLTIYYNLVEAKKHSGPGVSILDWVTKQLEEKLQQPIRQQEDATRQVDIPVCYDDEFAMDIKQMATAKNIAVEEIIQLHLSKQYKVFMLGFLPGFAYMGEVDHKIAIPRKPQPVTITAGSVGIAGSQTGIYPLVSPGGWQIIGRTPVKLFDADKAKPTLLQAGDRVQFYEIDKKEFHKIQNISLQKEKDPGAI